MGVSPEDRKECVEMLVNLTPHEIKLFNERKELVKSLPPTGQVARVAVTREKVGEIEGIPVFRAQYGEIEGLPEPRDGVYYVVSGLVATAAARAGREDVLSPGELLRDDQGRPIGSIGLQRPV